MTEEEKLEQFWKHYNAQEYQDAYLVLTSINDKSVVPVTDYEALRIIVEGTYLYSDGWIRAIAKADM